MPAAVGGGGGAAAVWASGETRMKANSSTKHAVNLAYLANEHEDHDGFAVEIYKPDERR